MRKIFYRKGRLWTPLYATAEHRCLFHNNCVFMCLNIQKFVTFLTHYNYVTNKNQKLHTNY